MKIGMIQAQDIKNLIVPSDSAILSRSIYRRSAIPSDSSYPLSGGSRSSLFTLESEVIPKKHRFRVGFGI